MTYALAGFLVASLALAQQPEPVKTVVTVTARPASVDASAADITVLSLDNAGAAESRPVADLLRFQPALYLGQMGQRGAMTVMSLRGGDPNFTLLLIDGVPINDVTDQLGGTVDVGAILALHASRIEL